MCVCVCGELSTANRDDETKETTSIEPRVTLDAPHVASLCKAIALCVHSLATGACLKGRPLVASNVNLVRVTKR